MHLDTSFFHASLLLRVKIDADLAINWACELLEQGFDTYHLRILAGLLQPDTMNQEEIWEIVGKVLYELNVPSLSKESATKIYLTTLLKGYLQQWCPKEKLLGELCSLCIVNDYCKLFYPFYALAHEESNIGYLSPPGLYYDKLENFEEIDKWVIFETNKLLDFLEQKDENYVLQQLKDINFYQTKIIYPETN